MNRDQRGGFTLVELLVGIVILLLAGWLARWAVSYFLPGLFELIPNWDTPTFWVGLVCLWVGIHVLCHVLGKCFEFLKCELSLGVQRRHLVGLVVLVAAGGFLWCLSPLQSSLSLVHRYQVRACVDSWLNEQKAGTPGYEFWELSETHWHKDKIHLAFLIRKKHKEFDKDYPINIAPLLPVPHQRPEYSLWITVADLDDGLSRLLDLELVRLWYTSQWGPNVSERLEKEVRDLGGLGRDDYVPYHYHQVFSAVRGWDITQVREIIRCPSCYALPTRNEVPIQCGNCGKAHLDPAKRPGLWQAVVRIDSSNNSGLHVSLLWRILVVNRGEGVGFKIARVVEHLKTTPLW